MHGTWARRAAWVRPDSALCDALRSKVESCGWTAIFPSAPFLWTGKNKVADRWHAACRLAHEIKDRARQTPGAPIVLIGHSHGGSVISYCLNQFPDVQKLVTSCVFMATPFFSVRTATWIGAFLRTLQIMLAILASVSVVSVLAWLTVSTGLLAELENRTGLYNWFLHPTRFLTAVASAVAAFWIVVSQDHEMHSKNLRCRAEREIKGQATASIPAGVNTFFVRVTGDEAAGVLVATQMAIYVNARIEAALGVAFRWIRDFIERKRHAWHYKIAFVTIFFATVFWTLEILTFWFDGKPFYWPSDIVSRVSIGVGFEEISNSKYYRYIFEFPVLYMSYGAYVVAIIFFSILSVFLGVAVFARFILSLTAKFAFGLEGASAPVLSEIAVEPLPSGQHLFHHSDWSYSDVPHDELLHSQVYTDPKAIDAIACWVLASL